MNVRDLLNSLGVSHLNATIMINYMFMNPATTDPKAPPVSLLVEHLQQGLQQLGAPVQVNGRIDDATNAALEQVLPGWLYQPWANAVHAVVSMRDAGGSLQMGPIGVQVQPMGSMPFGLPDVPGGVLTYAAAAAVAWHFYKKSKWRK